MATCGANSKFYSDKYGAVCGHGPKSVCALVGRGDGTGSKMCVCVGGEGLVEVRNERKRVS